MSQSTIGLDKKTKTEKINILTKRVSKDLVDGALNNRPHKTSRALFNQERIIKIVRDVT